MKEITDAQEGDGTKVLWTVRVSEGSNLIGLEPDPTVATSRLAMIYRKAEHGVAAVSRGDIRGAGLSEKAMGHPKSLSDLATKGASRRPIKVWVEREPAPISAEISRAIREFWDADYHDFGTVEGRLEVIQDASGAVKVRIKDYLYPRPIQCFVPNDRLDQVFANFRRRVEIEGRIHYRRDGTPISIHTDHIDGLPEDSDLPSAADVRGILAG